jgi:hypothetical protein
VAEVAQRGLNQSRKVLVELEAQAHAQRLRR